MVYIVLLIVFLVIIGSYAFWSVSIKRSEKEAKVRMEAQQEKCVAMSVEELLSIEDEMDLTEIVGCRIEAKLSAYENPEKGFAYLSEPEQTVYVLYDYYDNVFLLDFFGSEKREICVPRFSECLARVGAEEYKQVFDTFIYENNIDLYDLSKYAGQWKNKKSNDDINREAFDQFDKKIEDFPMLDEWIAKYIKEHISCF